VVVDEAGNEIHGFMMGSEQFGQVLEAKTGVNSNPAIQQRMKEIAKWSLMCASEMIEHRKVQTHQCK